MTDHTPEHSRAAPVPRLPYPRQVDRITSRTHTVFIYAVAGGLFSLITWMALTEVDKVTRGAGRVIPQLQNQVVQHLEGGIVQEILVKEGDIVAKGASLMRIENSFARAELRQAKLEIEAKTVRLLRLDAETRGGDEVDFPQAMKENWPDIVAREESLFRSRLINLREQLAILEDQLRQKQLELSELKSRYANTNRERAFVLERVERMRRLAKVGAVSANELIENERALQQIDSKISDLVHDIPRSEAAISEGSRRQTEARLRFRAEAEKERADIELSISKLNEAVAALQDRSVRSEITAPISGIVNKLFVSTIGGVVKGGEPLAQLVPTDVNIAVEAKLSPADRAEVWPGLPAVVKISAYEYSVYGGLKGKVVEISPDALQDERGQPYFRVRLEAGASDLGPKRPVVPGMLADVDILVGRHTVLDYLLRPVRKLRDNALRE
ncbi:MAG: HlyD family type I secretion periplasmic adaptor subunit [Hyphomicrobiaceae bacterium]|nr:HlyD family type I secretion periplasmic adaptor subunit [Hyphomicrobiaceae bacterium]